MENNDKLLTLGERVRWLRERAGLSLETLARSIGENKSTISNLEQRRSTTSRIAPKVATHFKVNLHWLETGSGPIEQEKGNVSGAPRPIIAVDDLAPLGYDEVEVPRLTLRPSAGSGRLQWETDELGERNRFRKSWCDRKGYKPQHLATLQVDGDSMAPTIRDGASITINTAETRLRNGKVHVIDYMGEFYIKRLFVQPDGTVLIRSDNPDKARFPDWTIPIEHGDALRILGSVVSQSSDVD